MEPSQLGSLKGLCGTRNTRVYTGSAPYGEGKSLRLVEVVLIRVSMTRELSCYAWLSIRSFLSLNRCRVVPLYREADAQQLLESRPAHTSVRLSLCLPNLQCKFIQLWRFTTMGPNPPLGSGPLSFISKVLSSWSSWASI